jgi:hypothetical protein
MPEDKRQEAEIAGVAEAITALEGRLIAARHLRLTDRIRLLESEKRRLESRLTVLQGEARSDKR